MYDICLIEVGREARVNEIQHSFYGPEYFWWRPKQGKETKSVTFIYDWMELLALLDDKAQRLLFGNAGGTAYDHAIVAVYYMMIPRTLDHKRSRNAKTANAEYYEHTCETKDGKSGFAFVRDDGRVLLLQPKWYYREVNAYLGTPRSNLRTSG